MVEVLEKREVEVALGFTQVAPREFLLVDALVGETLWTIELWHRAELAQVVANAHSWGFRAA